MNPRKVVALVLGLACAGVLCFRATIPLPNSRDGGLPKIEGEEDAVVVEIHASEVIGPISPMIYGMANPSEAHYRDLRLKLTRWGGNPASRYNWEKGNCWNAAADWEFRNGNYDQKAPSDRLPSGAADKGIEINRAHGAEMLLTIPMLGWVANDDKNSSRSLGVPAKGGDPLSPGSNAIAGYDPAKNRKRVSQRSVARKGKPFTDPPNLKDDFVAQDEWVFHLKRRFGSADKGGVRYYAMDNEPDLWSGTHRDMHPVKPDYDEILHAFSDYASAVKDVDPSAQVTGPVSWGWSGYFYSPRDEGNDRYHTAADRKKHGDVPFLPWFLKSVSDSDKKRGSRTLDILDIHYYPQGTGVYSGAKDAETNALRLRSVRSLWDDSYRDESWINEPVKLIPRLREWVRENYPGTKIGLTEWNWGADDTLNGGLAVAEVLGILGREQVDMACYWTSPKAGTPGFFAYKMFRNADGEGNGFGEIAVKTISKRPNDVSAYASLDSRTGKPVIMLINRQETNEQAVRLKFISGKNSRVAKGYRYSKSNLNGIEALGKIAMDSDESKLRLPPWSITLIRAE